jgi:20S proteasome alpha/beta subunit
MLEYNVIFGSIVAAFRCKDGIIVGSDGINVNKRGGSYINSRTSDRMIVICDGCIMCSVDVEGNSLFTLLCSDIQKEIRKNLFFRSNRYNNKPKSLPAHSIAKLARQLIHDKYHKAHVIVAGWDNIHNSENSKNNNSTENDKERKIIYSVHEILPGGSMIDGDYIVSGSGSEAAVSLIQEVFSQEHEQDNGINNVKQSKYILFPISEAINKVINVLQKIRNNHLSCGGRIQILSLKYDDSLKNFDIKKM